MTTVRTEVQLPIQRTASPPVEPTVRVASVPVDHAYVRHLAPITPGLTSMVGLPDPTPVGEAGPADALWWPPTMLDADWVDAHHDEFDVFHVHFGFDTMDATDLGRLVETLRRYGKPLVHTVHDLRSEHHQSGAPFEHLDVLVPAADALITLTPGAAAEIERRWARPALVLPHPHVVPLEIGWRVVFAMGSVLGLGIVMVRRHMPESPRWLLNHGHVAEAKRVLARIEDEVHGPAGTPAISVNAVRFKVRGPAGLAHVARQAAERGGGRPDVGTAAARRPVFGVRPGWVEGPLPSR